MAIAIQVAGLAEVYVEVGSTMTLLGYTRNGAEVTKEGQWLDVPCDSNGGDEGPPADVQFLGEIARIRVELTKWDSTVANTVLKRSKAAAVTAGEPMDAGTLMFASNAMRVCIKTANNPRNFPRAIPRQPVEINRGTKFSTLVCEFEAHKDANGVLYDASVSGI
jgi:hypothetical protein